MLELDGEMNSEFIRKERLPNTFSREQDYANVLIYIRLSVFSSLFRFFIETFILIEIKLQTLQRCHAFLNILSVYVMSHGVNSILLANKTQYLEGTSEVSCGLFLQSNWCLSFAKIN